MGQPLSQFEKRIELRWSDLDSSRHVNNAVYLSYLEEVRSAWLADALGGVAPVDDFVLARVEIDFTRELTLADEAVVARCRLGKLGNSSIRTLEEIAVAGGEIAARAEAVLVARTPGTAGSRPLTQAERDALAEL